MLFRSEAGAEVQEGESDIAVSAESGAPRPEQEFFTMAWAELVRSALEASEEFRRATSTWDGAFALGSGRDSVQFRIYKGRVLEAGARSPNGPQFTVGATELHWAELFTGAQNDLMARAMKGQFVISGSAYEYLRMTKPLVILVDVVRSMLHAAPWWKRP